MRLLFISCLLLAHTVFLKPATIPSGNVDQRSGDLYISLKSLNFFKNNEYSNPITEGYTLTGYFFQPELLFMPSDKTELRFGVHLLGYSGTNKYSAARPLFSVAWKMTERSVFTMGSLRGSDTHQMLDPHFNKERKYNQYSEDGFGFTYKGKRIFSDLWLSWENYIFRNDNEREIFTAGESFRYTSPLISGRFILEIPLQIQVRHLGGQISNYPEPVETYLNSAAGASFSALVNHEKNYRAGFEYLHFTGSELSGRAMTGIKSGHGEWFIFSFNYGSAELEAGYWLGRNYFAPNGNFIFGSVSDHRANTIISDRNLITLSANISLLPESFVEFYIGFDGYYDTISERFDNSVTLHLKLDNLIRITSLKFHR